MCQADNSRFSSVRRQGGAEKYDNDEVDLIKDRIKRAAKKHDIEISAE